MEKSCLKPLEISDKKMEVFLFYGENTYLITLACNVFKVEYMIADFKAFFLRWIKKSHYFF